MLREIDDDLLDRFSSWEDVAREAHAQGDLEEVAGAEGISFVRLRLDRAAVAEILRAEVDQRWPESVPRFLGKDPISLHAVCVALDLAARVGRGEYDGSSTFPGPPLLIVGPTGTGKDLLARAAHVVAGRKPERFSALNCASLTGALLESELFGHERGAFTGATTSKAGLVEAAAGGTLFLDEVGEMDPDLQPRLLRYLNDGSFRPVGATTEKTSAQPPMIVAATNVDVTSSGEAALRPDLLARLDGVSVQLRGLSERSPEEKSLLFGAMLAERGFAEPIPMAVIHAVQAYAWPGNLREMRAVVGALPVAQSRIDFDHLPPKVQRAALSFESRPAHLASLIQDRAAGDPVDGAVWRQELLAELRWTVEHLLSKDRASRSLGSASAAFAALGAPEIERAVQRERVDREFQVARTAAARLGDKSEWALQVRAALDEERPPPAPTADGDYNFLDVLGTILAKQLASSGGAQIADAFEALAADRMVGAWVAQEVVPLLREVTGGRVRRFVGRLLDRRLDLPATWKRARADRETFERVRACFDTDQEMAAHYGVNPSTVSRTRGHFRSAE